MEDPLQLICNWCFRLGDEIRNMGMQDIPSLQLSSRDGQFIAAIITGSEDPAVQRRSPIIETRRGSNFAHIAGVKFSWPASTISG
jgi:hypothetical protein